MHSRHPERSEGSQAFEILRFAQDDGAFLDCDFVARRMRWFATVLSDCEFVVCRMTGLLQSRFVIAISIREG